MGSIHTRTLGKLKNAYDSEKIWKIEWIGIGVVLVLMLCTYTYVDFRSLTIWSTNFWDVLFEGRVQDFFAYTGLNMHNVTHRFMGNDLVAVLPWSVWNLPIWAVQRFFHIDIVQSPLLMLWSKLFLVAAFALMMRYTYRLALLLMEKPDKNKALLAVFLSTSSMYFFVGVGFAGQNDIIFLLPVVMGLYALLKENPKPWLFYAAAAYSIAVKPFFLFPYIAILLLYDKRILRTALRVVYGLSGMVLCRILFAGFPFYKESLNSGPTVYVMRNLFSASLPASIGPASLLVLGLAAVYLWSYIHKSPTKTNFRLSVIYVTAAAFLLVVTTTGIEFYRPIVLLPFVPLLIVTSGKKRNLTTLLDTIMGIALIPGLWLRHSGVFFPSFMKASLIPIPERHLSFWHFKTPAKLMEEISYLRPAVVGVWVACAWALILLLHPSDPIKVKLKDGDHCDRFIYWVRLAAPLGFMAISLLCYFAS